jgi:hypothetical protein
VTAETAVECDGFDDKGGKVRRDEVDEKDGYVWRCDQAQEGDWL